MAFGIRGIGREMSAMAMAMAATSTRVMASPQQQPALNRRAHQGDRTSSMLANSRRRVVSLKPMLWQAAPRGFESRSSVVVAVAGGEIGYVFSSLSFSAGIV